MCMGCPCRFERPDGSCGAPRWAKCDMEIEDDAKAAPAPFHLTEAEWDSIITTQKAFAKTKDPWV